MKKLYEYSYFRNGVFEDGEEDQSMPQDAGMEGGDPNAMGGNANGMGGDPNGMGQMGGDTNSMDPIGGDPNAMGDNDNGMGGDPNAMGGEVNGANLAPNAGMEGGDPNAMDPMGGDANGMGADPNGMGDQPGPNDDVVDITALTDAQSEMQQSQEEIADQMVDVDKKLSTLMQIVNKFTQALDANDEKINDLKRELVKRTPTEEETMNVRLNAGGNPFDQKPEEFWDKFKDINNHYNITANNDAPQYQIKKSDIDNFNDRIISDGIDEFDEIPSTLKEYFVH